MFLMINFSSCHRLSLLFSCFPFACCEIEEKFLVSSHQQKSVSDRWVATLCSVTSSEAEIFLSSWLVLYLFGPRRENWDFFTGKRKKNNSFARANTHTHTIRDLSNFLSFALCSTLPIVFAIRWQTLLPFSVWWMRVGCRELECSKLFVVYNLCWATISCIKIQ